MNPKTRQKKRVLTPRFEKIFISASSAGLARTHRIMRIEREKEIQFLKLCCQIRLEDFKKDRSVNQREQRKLKRANRSFSQIND